jgi:hypothetical protein
MTGWVMKTEFLTTVPMGYTLDPKEHYNSSSVEFETEAEARMQWRAKDTDSTYHRVMSLIAPDGRVVTTRVATSGGV